MAARGDTKSATSKTTKAKPKSKATAKASKSDDTAAETNGDADALVKVCLCDRGQDAETPWAVDLGPATGKGVPAGSRLVRLVNVPFFHAKPTWGDTIVVSPVEDGLLTWDSRGVAWSKIDTRIEEDGGRYAMIVDYLPEDDDESGDAAFSALSRACHGKRTDLQTADVVCEGAYGPRDGKPGRVYLAVVDALEPEEVMTKLRAAKVPCELLQIHPEPAKPKKAKKQVAAKPKKQVAAKPKKKPAAKSSKPAAKKPAKKPAKKSKR